MSGKDISLKMILTSGRTIEQGISLVGTKTTAKAKEATGVCFLDPEDIKKLQVLEGENIEITTSEGTIIVKAKKSNDAPHQGIAFMPLGIYANWVTPPGDAGIGVPQYKGIEAVITPTKKRVLDVNELVAKLEGRKISG